MELSVTQGVVTLASNRATGDYVGEPGAVARAIMRGDATRDERKAHILAALVAAGLTADSPIVPHPVTVTAHQYPVLCAIADGYSTTTMGEVLPQAFGTRKRHVGNLLRRFGVSSRVELVVEAVRCGILPNPLAASDATPDDDPTPAAPAGCAVCGGRTTREREGVRIHARCEGGE